MPAAPTLTLIDQIVSNSEQETNVTEKQTKSFCIMNSQPGTSTLDGFIWVDFRVFDSTEDFALSTL
jgi:hypothetical protein